MKNKFTIRKFINQVLVKIFPEEGRFTCEEGAKLEPLRYAFLWWPRNVRGIVYWLIPVVEINRIVNGIRVRNTAIKASEWHVEMHRKNTINCTTDAIQARFDAWVDNGILPEPQTIPPVSAGKITGNASEKWKCLA